MYVELLLPYIPQLYCLYCDKFNRSQVFLLYAVCNTRNFLFAVFLSFNLWFYHFENLLCSPSLSFLIFSYEVRRRIKVILQSIKAGFVRNHSRNIFLGNLTFGALNTLTSISASNECYEIFSFAFFTDHHDI